MESLLQRYCLKIAAAQIHSGRQADSPEPDDACLLTRIKPVRTPVFRIVWYAISRKKLYIRKLEEDGKKAYRNYVLLIAYVP